MPPHHGIRTQTHVPKRPNLGQCRRRIDILYIVGSGHSHGAFVAARLCEMHSNQRLYYLYRTLERQQKNIRERNSRLYSALTCILYYMYTQHMIRRARELVERVNTRIVLGRHAECRVRRDTTTSTSTTHETNTRRDHNHNTGTKRVATTFRAAAAAAAADDPSSGGACVGNDEDDEDDDD